jgi:hypothetical protein
MAVYAIPNLPVYSPLAGIADLYKTYKDIEHQQEQDAYTKEKDAREFDTNKAFKERELSDSARRTQSTIDYYNGELALKADPNAPANVAAMMHARASQAAADAARQNASLGARKYNDEMKWTNSALRYLGVPGQSSASLPQDDDHANLSQLVYTLNNVLGGH